MRASDPGAIVANLSGIDENGCGCGGDTSTFSVRFTGDGTDRSFDLEFVDSEFGGTLASIPVTISFDAVPSSTSESSGERSTVLSCAYECRNGGRFDGWKSISTLQLANPGTRAVSAGLAFIDGRQNIIAQSRIELGANDLDELHVCRTLAMGGVAQPQAGLVQVYLPRTRVGNDSAVYGWLKDAQGRFKKHHVEPYVRQPYSVAKTECRVVPPSVNSAATLAEQIADQSPPAIPALLINQTDDP